MALWASTGNAMQFTCIVYVLRRDHCQYFSRIKKQPAWKYYFSWIFAVTILRCVCLWFLFQIKNVFQIKKVCLCIHAFNFSILIIISYNKLHTIIYVVTFRHDIYKTHCPPNFFFNISTSYSFWLNFL